MCDRSECSVEAVFGEVEEAQLVQGGEGIDGAAEVEGGEGEGGDTIFGALYSYPIGCACGSGVGGGGPVGEEGTVKVSLRAEEGEGGGVIGCVGGGGIDRKECKREKVKGKETKVHLLKA